MSVDMTTEDYLRAERARSESLAESLRLTRNRCAVLVSASDDLRTKLVAAEAELKSVYARLQTCAGRLQEVTDRAETAEAECARSQSLVDLCGMNYSAACALLRRWQAGEHTMLGDETREFLATVLPAPDAVSLAARVAELEAEAEQLTRMVGAEHDAKQLNAIALHKSEVECARLRAENEKLEYGAHDPPPLFLSDKASSALRTRAEKAEAALERAHRAHAVTLLCMGPIPPFAGLVLPPPVAALVRTHAKDPIGVCEGCGARAPLRLTSPQGVECCAWDGGCTPK